MAGSPKKRARRLAAEAAKNAGVEKIAHIPPTGTNVWKGTPVRPETRGRPPAPREEVISVDGMEAMAASNPDQFEKLLKLSLNKAVEVMEMKLSEDHREFGRLLSLQASITSTVFGVTARVSGENLRRQSTDKIGDLLKRVRGELPVAEKQPDEPIAQSVEEKSDHGLSFEDLC